MTPQFRVSSVARLTFRSWLRNLLPFTLLSALLSSILALALVADPSGIGTADLLFSPEPSYMTLALRGLISLLIPMISARVVQSLDGVQLSLARSIRLSGHGILTLIAFSIVAFAFSYVPILSIIVALLLLFVGFVAIPAAVTERLNPLAAMARSFRLIRRRWLLTIALALASVVVGAIPYWTTYALLSMRPDLTSELSGNMADTIARLQLLRPYALGLVAMSCVLMPFQGILRAVSYVLLRHDSTSAQQELAAVFE